MDTLARCRGDRFALSALKRKRSELSSDIIEMKRQLRHKQELLVHVDATLRLLDPNGDPSRMPPKRPVRRVKLFKHGELGRLIVDALRRADGKSMPLRDIVSDLIAVGELGEDARRSLSPRVRGNLAYLVRQDKVAREGDVRRALWRLRS